METEKKAAEKKAALVTGANRGIGLEICRGLGKQDYRVLLTSRDGKKGVVAADRLIDEGLDIKYHQLDVTSPESVEGISRFIEKKFGRLDVLVNNAGAVFDPQDLTDMNGASIFHTNPDILRKSLEINTFGPLALIQAVIPIMKKNGYGRIVNLSSGMGQLSDMGGGWPGYRISKTALNALTRIVAFELKGSNILINSVCPGWVKTDLGGENATRSVQEGAETPLWLAGLPDDGPSGGFFRDKKEIPW